MAKSLTIAGTVALFLAIGLWNTLGSGLGPSEPGEVVQKRLDRVPLALGNWVGQDLPMHEKQVKVAHAEAYLNRSYMERSSGRTVNVLVIYGNPGDLGAHDPKVCYGSTGHELAGPYTRRNFPAGVANDFWAARFEKPGAKPSEVFWAWGTGGGWQAPDSPRLAFATQGRIYKLYVQRPAEEAGAQEPTFIPEFLEELRNATTAPVP
jgi:hypothetical protein